MGKINSPNRLGHKFNQLGTTNNQLLMSKMEGFDRELLPFNKTLSQLIMSLFLHYLIN